MSDDLVAFVSARLDEDEAAAKAATPGVWVAGAGNTGDVIVEQSGGGHLVADLPDCISDHGDWRRGDAAHIVRHDPARVLREVTAKRDIVRRCWPHMNELDVYPNGLVSPRAYLARMVLLNLAAVYSDHPDYRQEWAERAPTA